MSVAVGAAIVVGAAFLLAGGAKIAAGESWSVQARALGAPTSVIPFVPWLEIVVGGLLAAQVGRAQVAAIALVMLTAFTGLLVVRLAKDQHPPCVCFGSWTAKPLSWRHVVRNGALIVLAALAIVA